MESNNVPAKMVSVGSGTHTIAYSYDGVIWIPVLNSADIFTTGYGVSYNTQLSQWVAVGEGANSIAYSSDGITWIGLGTSVFSAVGYGVM